MAAGLSGADLLPPGAGAVELGVEANLDRMVGYAELAAKPAPGLSLFGRGEAYIPWSSFEPEARAIFGLRYTW